MKTKKFFTKALSLILALVSLFSVFTCITASAASGNAFNAISSSRYAKVYTLSTSGSTIPYTTSSLKTRGTVSYGASKNAYIANSTDEIYVLQVGKTGSNNWAKVSYPAGSKRVIAYINLSTLTAASNSASHTKSTSSGKFYCAPRKGYSTSSSYYVAKYDTVYLLKVVSTSGVNCQIMYPTSGNTWRIAWCKYSDYAKYCTVQLQQPTSISLNKNTVTLSGTGVSTTVTATVKPSNAANKAVSWTTSNAAVATVSSSGKITAVGNGTAKITAKTCNNKVATVTVTCKNCNQIVSVGEISSAASRYGISTSSNAYKALQLINSKYGKSFTSSQKSGTLVFIFEGVGSSSSSSSRMNAMCVIVKNGRIVYVNRNCSTIPDYPFTPSKNSGTPMPTIKSGIYSFTTTNHRGKYAALNVTNANVVRFNSKSSYYSSTSTAINVHRRDTNSIAPSNAGWVNSAGCLLIGKSGTSSSSEYANFIKAVGIVSNSANGNSKYSTYVTGKIVVDRSYASAYLSNVGYSSGAIKTIG